MLSVLLAYGAFSVCLLALLLLGVHLEGGIMCFVVYAFVLSALLSYGAFSVCLLALLHLKISTSGWQQGPATRILMLLPLVLSRRCAGTQGEERR